MAVDLDWKKRKTNTAMKMVTAEDVIFWHVP